MKHPGEILQKKLKDNFMSRKELAIRTGVTEKHICTIVNGEKNISTTFAKKLSYVFENTEYWLNLQARYDSEQMQIKEKNSISEEELSLLKPLNNILQYLIECGYIHNNCGNISKILQLRDFLGIYDLTQIPKITYNAAYRAQLSDNIKSDPYIMFVWQRLCEKETENIEVNNILNLSLLHDKIPEIKSLIFGDINDGVERLQKIFASCGIAFQVVKNFRGAPVQGFIKHTAANRLILCLTIRGKRADSFWFTLFHEIGHILNGDNSVRFVDFDSVHNSMEDRADKFAQNVLIPPDKYRRYVLSDNGFSWESIETFAESINMAPFIVLGRLQNDGYLDWTDYAHKIVKYDWA